MRLPRELWLLILKQCDPSSKLMMRATCKLFRKMVVFKNDGADTVLVSKAKIANSRRPVLSSTTFHALLYRWKYPQYDLIFHAIRIMDKELICLAARFILYEFDEMSGRKKQPCCVIAELIKEDCESEFKLMTAAAAVGRLSLIKQIFYGKKCSGCHSRKGISKCFGGIYFGLAAAAAINSQSEVVTWLSRKCSSRSGEVVACAILSGSVEMVEIVLSQDYKITQTAIDKAFEIGGNMRDKILAASPDDPEEAMTKGLVKLANWLETGKYDLLEWRPRSPPELGF